MQKLKQNVLQHSSIWLLDKSLSQCFALSCSEYVYIYFGEIVYTIIVASPLTKKYENELNAVLFIYLGCIRNRHFLSLKYCTVTSNCLCLSVCQTGTFFFSSFFSLSCCLLETEGLYGSQQPQQLTGGPRSLPQKQREIWCDCIPKIKPSTNRIPGSSSVHNPAFTCSMVWRWNEGTYRY